MKANELRVGNLVFNNNTGKYKAGSNESIMFIHEVTKNDIWGDGVSIYDRNIDLEYDVSMGGISPIPLTEELLLKCGFMDRGDSLIGYVFAKSFVYYITKRCDYFAFRMNTLNDQSVFIREVKYLHELQNLYFAITGEELKVEL